MNYCFGYKFLFLYYNLKKKRRKTEKAEFQRCECEITIN